MTLYGWDCSDYDVDRGLTEAEVKASYKLGIRFFTFKGCETAPSKVFYHTNYGRMMNAAKAAGIPFLGMYIVPRTPGVSIAKQVDNAIAYANKQTPWWKTFNGWFWQVDLEHWEYDKVAAKHGVEMAKLLEQKTGKKVVLYAPKWAYGNTVGGSYPLWASDYGSNTATEFKQLYKNRVGDKGSGWTKYSNRTPMIWQYGSRAKIGTQSTCDANAFRGSEADFAKMIGMKVVVPPVVTPPVPPVTPPVPPTPEVPPVTTPEVPAPPTDPPVEPTPEVPPVPEVPSPETPVEPTPGVPVEPEVPPVVEPEEPPVVLEPEIPPLPPKDGEPNAILAWFRAMWEAIERWLSADPSPPATPPVEPEVPPVVVDPAPEEPVEPTPEVPTPEVPEEPVPVPETPTDPSTPPVEPTPETPTPEVPVPPVVVPPVVTPPAPPKPPAKPAMPVLGKHPNIKKWDNTKLNSVGNGIISLMEFYPKKKEIYVTSGMEGDHAGVSHHYGNLKYNGSPTAAIDFGCGTNAVMGRDLAKWIEDNFGDLCVELIHSTPFSSDDGFYIKNGRRTEGYSSATRLAHRNHVHLALSDAQVKAAYARLKKKYAGSYAGGTTTPTTPTPAPAVTYYTVKSGDNLTKIADKYNTSVSQLMKWNSVIKDADEIDVGWKLRVK